MDNRPPRITLKNFQTYPQQTCANVPVKSYLAPTRPQSREIRRSEDRRLCRSFVAGIPTCVAFPYICNRDVRRAPGPDLVIYITWLATHIFCSYNPSSILYRYP
ncbi:hypothetical protein BDN70DRAFT_878302 [Pholiota conissans]|uniref:Uncharacterized protein n=1 Tax=Pholiota conissans TaxID=109636 RepID=A0A9P6D143_9AGAR|nr:hypothetical protein BDN70DRAFT_878302 [Pholiota conissans]